MTELFLLDSSFSHCEFSNNPVPIVNRAKDIVWNRNLTEWKGDRAVFITESGLHNQSWTTIPKDMRVLWLLEPIGLIPHAYNFARSNYGMFRNVISCNKEMTDIPNYKWVPFGGSWIDEMDRGDHNKSKLVNIICSGKRQLEGHRLRHLLIEQQRLAGLGILDVCGNGYSPVAKKIEALRDYKYQVVIENERHPGYFTEKLIDCFVTKTIPIYFGAPDIGNYFDASQMIICNSFDGINNEIQKIRMSDMWNPDINFERAKAYNLAEDYIFENLKEIWQ